MYKVARVIIKIPFDDANHVAHGVGILIDYEYLKIYQLIFKKGKLIEKNLGLDKKDNDDVFNKGSIKKVIGLKHEQAFEFKFDNP